MPRWSKTIRSRVATIGPSSLRKSSANGSAGLPRSARQRDDRALRFADGARWRRIASVTVPGSAPPGSSGTVRWPQAKSLLSAQGANAIGA